MDTDTRIKRLEDKVQQLLSQPTKEAKQQLTYPLDYVSQKILSGNTTTTTSSIPAGAVFSLATTTIPSGYLECNGATVLRADYPDLYTAIGDTYGVNNGSTNFILPDYRNVFLLGKDTSGTHTTLYGSGGAETQALGVSNLPDHQHTIYAFNTGSGHASFSSSTSNTTASSGFIPPSGGNGTSTGDAFSTMPPYRIVVVVIKT